MGKIKTTDVWFCVCVWVGCDSVQLRVVKGRAGVRDDGAACHVSAMTSPMPRHTTPSAYPETGSRVYSGFLPLRLAMRYRGGTPGDQPGRSLGRFSSLVPRVQGIESSDNPYTAPSAEVRVCIQIACPVHFLAVQDTPHMSIDEDICYYVCNATGK